MEADSGRSAHDDPDRIIEQLSGQINQLEARYQNLQQAMQSRIDRMEEAFATRLLYEQLLFACSQVLLANVEREEAITETLYEVLVATDVSRVYLCKNFDIESGQKGYFIQTDEMCALNVKPQSKHGRLTHYYYNQGLQRWWATLSAGNAVIGTIELLPESEQKFLQAHQAISILILPLWVEGRWYGFIGLEDINQRHVWPDEDVQLLQTVVDMVGSYIGRSHSESALIESEEKYRTLIEQSSDAVFLIYGGRFELINRRFTEMFGVTEADVRSPDFSFANIVAASNHSTLYNLVNYTQQARFHRPPYEFVALDKNGNDIVVELTVSYPFYKRGLATQGIIRDITERKRIEAERREAYNQIQKYAGELATMVKEEKRQRKIATILAQVVASASLTLSKDELLSDILIKLKELVPYDGAAVYLHHDDKLNLEAVQEKKVDFVDGPSDELFREMQSGKAYILVPDAHHDNHQQKLFGTNEARSWIGAPLLIAQRVMGYLSVYRQQPGLYTRDDAELVQAFAHQVAQTIRNASLFEELKTTQAQLVQRERLAALGQMSATVAHELRNPLMSLRMGIEYITFDITQDHPHYRSAMMLQSNIDRIVRVTENILFVARTPRKASSWGTLQEVIEKEAGQWEFKLNQKGITCTLDIDQSLAPIYLDFDQIERALTNLIANSIDAMSSGGELTLALQSDNGNQVIIVADTGPGISEKDRARIFEPFFTTKPRGTGLGLAIVKQIIDGHRGTIEVLSKVDEGTRFILSLPQDQ